MGGLSLPISRKGFLGEHDPHRSLTLEGTILHKQGKGASQGKTEGLSLSPVQVTTTQELREEDTNGEGSGSNPTETGMVGVVRVG